MIETTFLACDDKIAFIRLGTKLHRQIVGIPMCTKCAPLITDLVRSAITEWLERLGYGAENRGKVCFAMRRLENSVSQAVNGYLFRIGEG